MRILIISKKFPYPTVDGETIVVYNYLKALNQLGHSFTFFCLNTKKQHFNIDDMPNEMKNWGDYKTIDIDTGISISGALKNLFSNKSYHTERFYSKACEGALKVLLEEQKFDVIQFETLYPTVYLDVIRQITKAKCVLRAHNVESEIWRKIADNTTNPIKKWYLNLQTKRLLTYEKNLLNKLDAIVPISEDDAAKFKKMGAEVPVFASTSGFDFSDYLPDASKVDKQSLAFIGSMDWLPNQEGVKWLLNEVWPLVNKQLPNHTLQIAGRNMPDWMKSLKQTGVKIIGEVADAKAFINSKNIILVPLLSGSGVRIKIIEALALAKPVISTSLGFEGIPAKNQEQLIIADSPQDFAQAIINLSKSTEMQLLLAKNGRKFVINQYNLKIIVSRLMDFYNHLIMPIETN